MRIFVGNLDFEITSRELQEAFGVYGSVTDVEVVRDRNSGRPRGFAFLEIPNDEEGMKAIVGMNGQPMKGRPLTVNKARPKRDR